MDKNRFILIISLAIVILIFLFTNYQKTKKESLQNYQYYQSLLTKIKQIQYLKQTYNNTNMLKHLRKCNISDTNKITINCSKLSNKNFKKISNLIFNSNLNISKFKITKDSIYVEILK